MAKPRKSKGEDNGKGSSAGVVQHQKLCLSIDMNRRLIYGYTELKILVPESGIIGLHAGNMTIESITVDREPAEFDFFPHYQNPREDGRWNAVSCAGSAADAAGAAYISSLRREISPNLHILCRKSERSTSDGLHLGTSGQTVLENVRLVRIDYWAENPESGIHFSNSVLHTNNQTRRAHYWFPCMDACSQRCCYDLEFTVDLNLVAVSNGTLLFQVLSKDDPPRKTFVYKLSVPVNASAISLAVAPFEIFLDRHCGILSHMCLSPNLLKLQNTVGFLHTAFSHYEDFLSSSFPFGSYTQAFIEPEMVISGMGLGASLCIFSSQLLFDEKVIDQTIDTRIKLSYALAKQWFGVFITAETSNDDWLVDGLAGYLMDSFIKRFLGNNEARYRRYKANLAVCKGDVSGATALGASSPSADLYGTQCLGFYGKLRSWKAVAVLQMLEQQMGPESFCKILQIIVSRAHSNERNPDPRTISTKEFRHFANKIGNLERPFLKEFFPRWVESCGCPVLRAGFCYSRRRNMIEFAVLRSCTAAGETVYISNGSPVVEIREEEAGWPGMMSIRVHEVDGMYDHPILPVAGETWQLLEIQCHSKFAAKRVQKPKKGFKLDGSDDTGEGAFVDTRSSVESPLLWVRMDPEMEYLAEVHYHQPVQMWINQLEKDKDVVAQSQAIATLETLPLSFATVNSLNAVLIDSKAFWRIRVEAAFALAATASEVTDWAGLQNLLKFYQSRRYDPTTGLPRANDFHDLQEYLVLQAIPHAVAVVRMANQKSPHEAVEFILQLLKYNDNHGNPYSDVYWLAGLVQSIGELDFCPKSLKLLYAILKRIDRLMQFDRLMPSDNGVLTISCIHTLTQIALKLSHSMSLELVFDLIKSFHGSYSTLWQVRIEASKALLDLEFYSKGIDATLSLFVKYIEEEPSFRGQEKLAAYVMQLCQTSDGCVSNNSIKVPSLVSLLILLESRKAFNNIFLRHYIFCILQVLACRPPTLHGIQAPCFDSNIISSQRTQPPFLKLKISSKFQDPSPVVAPQFVRADVLPITAEGTRESLDNTKQIEETISSEKRVSVVKIRLKQSATSSRVEKVTPSLTEYSYAASREVEAGPTSSASVDAPMRMASEPTSTSYHNMEVASPKNEEATKELQCTADSQKDGRLLFLANGTGAPVELEDAGTKSYFVMNREKYKRKSDEKGNDDGLCVMERKLRMEKGEIECSELQASLVRLVSSVNSREMVEGREHGGREMVEGPAESKVPRGSDSRAATASSSTHSKFRIKIKSRGSSSCV